MPTTLSYTDPENGRIRYIEVLDQTQGVGSSADINMALGKPTIFITFGSLLVQLPIDYIVNIYADPFIVGQSGISFGQMTDRSEYIGNQTITASDMDEYGMFVFTDATHLLDYARLRDLTVENSGVIVTGVIVDRSTLRVIFKRTALTRYLLQLYGQTRPPPDVIVGTVLSTSVLLDSNTILVNGTTRSSYVLKTAYPIDRLEVLNQNLHNVNPELVVGEVGGNQVMVLFEAADERQIIHFKVNVYGRLQ